MRFTPSMLQHAVEIFSSNAESIGGRSRSARREALSEAARRMVDDAPRHSLEDAQHQHLVTGLKNSARKWPKKVLQGVEQRNTPTPAGGPGWLQSCWRPATQLGWTSAQCTG
ncbi:unnamed protein product [Symbiodinium necroappetens]|uniref:Uncharacterized protein n=1 Tax=Symbiodinium necroappetens TaxID=1628268 RepID=A0A812VKW4_9DINO|nr:unnamed protein product [Symbiodinium necroappetens]